MPEISIQDKAKRAAGFKAADLIQDGMTLGLGTGTTISYFIARLIERCQEGLKVAAIATSNYSATLALKGNIPLLSNDSITKIDLAVDGADEIDPKKRMIKGGGGALLREKITGYMADEMMIIVDETKCVEKLGTFPLALEIAPFGYAATLEHLKNAGYTPTLRKGTTFAFFLTDNGNYIVDLHFKDLIDCPEELDQKLHAIPGILETGLFLNLAKKVIVGYPDGMTTILK